MENQQGGRQIAIDIFRAVTMLLMIFVNDLWSLKHIPRWLEHAGAEEDYMGLADIVFPCFLVIVGMSIPFAVERRIIAGDSKQKMIWHIVLRTISLLVMGVFIVNLDNYNEAYTGINRQWFQVLMVAAFFLIWNVYPVVSDKRRFIFLGLQAAGVLILTILAIRYRGDDGSGGITTISKQWWGILGLIGWAYGGSALIYLLCRKKWTLLFGAWLFFVIVNILSHAGWLVEFLPSFLGNALIIGDGAFHAFAMSGVLATLIIKKTFQHYRRILIMLGVGVGLVLAGLFLNNYFVISKIKATPPWIFICTGIAYLLYAIIFYLAEVRGQYKWFKAIEIAGKNTLTCYLVPYFVYALAVFSGFSLPDSLVTGGIGILKSLAFSFLIIYITRLLNGLHIRLKL